MLNKQTIQFELTPEQQAPVRHATDREAPRLKLTLEELEERIAPVGLSKLMNC